MKITPKALLDLADRFELILDFDKEGICFHVCNGEITPHELIDLISEHQDAVKPVWLKRQWDESCRRWRY